jgi:hypothetical protein
MKTARIINAIFWLYMWLSDAMMPVVENQENFWTEKAKQLFRLNRYLISDLYNLPSQIGLVLGTAIIPLLLWFVIDWILRRAGRAKTTMNR